MNIGDVFSINLNADPDASCYKVVPSSIISNSGNSITLTPSASTILDITGGQKGTFSVDLQLQPKSTCVQNYPNPSSASLSFKVNVYNRYNPAIVPA